MAILAINAILCLVNALNRSPLAEEDLNLQSTDHGYALPWMIADSLLNFDWGRAE
jgi:hypothetical protein